jgi:hypothetical protein
LKLGFPARRAFTLQMNHCVLANCRFVAVSQHQMHIAGEGQCYDSTKNGPSELNQLATAAGKVRQWCSETAAATVTSSQSTVLLHHLNHFLGLEL